MDLSIGFTLTLVLLTSTLLISCATLDPKKESSLSVTETAKFSDVNAATQRLSERYGSENLLLVLDIDNTLLTSSTDLGGDIWYQWQRKKLPVKPSESQSVDCLFEDSIGLLYELVPMELTEQQVPELIAGWQSSGITVMALTTRAPKYRAATERELSRHGIDFAMTALSPEGEPAPVYREMLEREMSYMQGVMMTTGMNKGDMLSYILEKTGRSFDAIIFVDDSLRNIDNMRAEYSSDSRGSYQSMEIIHYQKIEHDRIANYGAILTEEQATDMANSWNSLNETLDALFPARVIENGCLGSG